MKIWKIPGGARKNGVEFQGGWWKVHSVEVRKSRSIRLKKRSDNIIKYYHTFQCFSLDLTTNRQHLYRSSSSTFSTSTPRHSTQCMSGNHRSRRLTQLAWTRLEAAECYLSIWHFPHVGWPVVWKKNGRRKNEQCAVQIDRAGGRAVNAIQRAGHNHECIIVAHNFKWF